MVMFDKHLTGDPPTVRILDIPQVAEPINSPIRNAYIDFSKMTSSLVAVVTDVTATAAR